MNGIVETFTGEKTVEIANSKFESLIRQSERMNILKEIVKSSKVTDKFLLIGIINPKESEGEE